MPIIPLVVDQTVVTTEEAFELAHGRRGRAVLIRSFDANQLQEEAHGNPNCSYDLRVGPRFFDHRDDDATTLGTEQPIKLLPGAAVVIQTEESVHFPESTFGLIVPRVKWLQKGLSNTMSKVDPGYNGHLQVALFNLGKRTVELPRGEPFCSLVVFRVGEGCRPYDKPGKEVTGAGMPPGFLRRITDKFEAHVGFWLVISIIASILVGLLTACVLGFQIYSLLQHRT